MVRVKMADRKKECHRGNGSQCGGGDRNLVIRSNQNE